MLCDKCKSGYMVDDSHYDVKVFKCWVCGNRFYPDHPKRQGDLVCSRCGEDLEPGNHSGYCKNCLKYVNLNAEPMKERTYGQTTCACGTIFIRKSPRQMFHSKDCRKRPVHFSLLMKPDVRVAHTTK
ncbi:MAG TPA: hypothetical protein VMT71_18365 [Syntrophorhabdales bacterium]|nr:hypothetical protein [Syntrophorhabdales bacterium]